MEHLLPYCTDRQRELIMAVIEHGGVSQAARATGVNERTIRRYREMVEKKAASAGVAPERDLNYPLPPGQAIRGTSTLINKATGESMLQWVKTDVAKEAREALMRECVDALKEDLPRYEPLKFNGATNHDLLSLITITDAHVGMKAWHKEAGADWDLEIAEDTITSAVFELINACPCSATGVIAQMGDFLHWDSSVAAVTPTSGHPVDADGRYSKVVQVAIRILRRVIQYALTKFERVVFINCEGNHDLSSSIWLQELFKAVYENEPRVEVIDSVLPYYVYQHGETMLAWHHGHLKKNDQLPLFFATQFHFMWGRTKKRYCHTGHRHHLDEKEHSGMYVIQHSTLAAKDAYAARGGWSSERTIKAITYHKSYGEVGRVTVTPEMVSK